jgi:glycosyltransferase involved in cell wall biosynthesis
LNKPKILILTHCFPSDISDIPGNFLPEMCGELADLGCEVAVLTQKMSAGISGEIMDKAKADIISFDWKGGGERFSGIKLSSFSGISSAVSLILNGRKAFKKLIRAGSYDLVLNCWAVPSGLWSYSLCDKKRSAVWALGSDISVYSKKITTRSLLKKIIRKNGFVFANSISLKAEVEKLSKKPAALLYTGRQLPAPAVRYSPSNTFRLVFVGRLEKVKGPDLLLSALILSGIENFILNFIGDGSMRKELEKFSESNGIAGKVKFSGMKDPACIADSISGADYLVISSRSESMPVVFWEAMQVSTPVLATRTGDLEYYCEKFNVGRTCLPDENSLSELLQFASEFRPLRGILAANTAAPASLSSIKTSARTVFNIASGK